MADSNRNTLKTDQEQQQRTRQPKADGAHGDVEPRVEGTSAEKARHAAKDTYGNTEMHDSGDK